jgi:hypothetical protein
MRHLLYTAAIAIFLVGSVAAANLNLYNGTWMNPSPAPQAITKLEIGVVDSKVHVHAFGQLHPKKDYDWGAEPANSYSDGHLTTRYQTSSCVRDLTISLTGSGRLVVKTHTHYTDSSGRPDRDDTDTLKRFLTPTTQQTPKPVDPVNPKPMDPINPKPASNTPTGKY